MIGGAGAKIGRIVDLAEELYERVTELREQVAELRQTTVSTHERVTDIEAELADQRALLEAVAEAQGVDVEATREPGGGDRGADGVDTPADEPA